MYESHSPYLWGAGLHVRGLAARFRANDPGKDFDAEVWCKLRAKDGEKYARTLRVLETLEKLARYIASDLAAEPPRDLLTAAAEAKDVPHTQAGFAQQPPRGVDFDGMVGSHAHEYRIPGGVQASQAILALTSGRMVEYLSRTSLIWKGGKRLGRNDRLRAQARLAVGFMLLLDRVYDPQHCDTRDVVLTDLQLKVTAAQLFELPGADCLALYIDAATLLEADKKPVRRVGEDAAAEALPPGVEVWVSFPRSMPHDVRSSLAARFSAGGVHLALSATQPHPWDHSRQVAPAGGLPYASALWHLSVGRAPKPPPTLKSVLKPAPPASVAQPQTVLPVEVKRGPGSPRVAAKHPQAQTEPMRVVRTGLLRVSHAYHDFDDEERSFYDFDDDELSIHTFDEDNLSEMLRTFSEERAVLIDSYPHPRNEHKPVAAPTPSARRVSTGPPGAAPRTDSSASKPPATPK